MRCGSGLKGPRMNWRIQMIALALWGSRQCLLASIRLRKIADSWIDAERWRLR